MNLFEVDIEQLDLDEAKAALAGCTIDPLPGVPQFLSKRDCSNILGVSMKVIDKLIESGDIPLTEIPDEDIPVSYDLFGSPVDQPSVECILRSDLAIFLEKSLLCHKPILTLEEDR